MDVIVKGKHIDVGEALRSHAETNLRSHVGKYFSRAHDAQVTLSRAAHGFRADISVHPKRGFLVQGGAEGVDAYVAFDAALERILKQLRRYKRRLVDQHQKGRGDGEVLAAQQYVIAPEAGDEVPPEETPPVVVAEMPHEIALLTVGEAVMRMDLADAPVVMFRNRANGAFNVVYRRPDGNIGWIDPTNSSRA